MSEFETLTDTEQLLLMAALILGFGPDFSLVNANSAKVVNQALRWRGLSDEEIHDGWVVDEYSWIESCGPIHAETYNALIRMTLHIQSQRLPERSGAPLFEGKGNWGIPGNPDHPPSWPHYNSSRLTLDGERVAQELLTRHPEYQHG